MSAASNQITELYLRAEGTQIVFRRGPEGELELRYNNKVFCENELKSETTIFGLAVSAVLEEAPDSHTTFLTLNVPAANRDPEGAVIPLSTFAVITKKQTTIGGPGLVKGQIDLFEVIAPLDGTAR